MTNLFDRAIWDFSGGQIDARHPAFRHPEAMRPWARRPIECDIGVVKEVEARVEAFTEDILQHLGYGLGDITASEPKISLTAINRGDIVFDPAAPRLHARKSRFLVRIAATLHACEKVAATEIKFRNLREFLTSLLADANAPDPTVKGLAYQLIALSHFEARCEAEGVPFEALSDLFAWDPFEVMDSSSQNQLTALHARAREIEQEAAAIVGSIDDAISGNDGFSEAQADAIATALETLPSTFHNKVAVTGSHFHHRLRLAWDCLQIWLEIWPDRWPSNTWIVKQTPSSKDTFVATYPLFLAKVYEVATGVHPDEKKFEDEDEVEVQGMVRELRDPIRKGLTAFLAQEERSADAKPFVAVGDPLANNGRFLNYLVDRDIGPAGYLERWKKNKKLGRTA